MSSWMQLRPPMRRPAPASRSYLQVRYRFRNPAQPSSVIAQSYLLTREVLSLALRALPVVKVAGSIGGSIKRGAGARTYVVPSIYGSSISFTDVSTP